MTETATARLEPGVAVAVEGLSRQSSAAAEDFAPATSIFQRLFRREWQGITLGEDSDIDEDDDQDDGDDEDFLDQVTEEDESDRWALSDVSFTLPAGTALAVVGPASGGRSLLLRILAGHVPPTAGRALVRGRRGPTVEAASRLMRPDMHPDQNLKLLAGLLGVPRSQRELFVDATLELAFGARRGGSPADLKNAVQRVASASVFDPTADVLIVDELPASDPRFLARCLDRLGDSLARGASALVSSDELDVLRELATSALWLERGRVVAHGPAADVIRELERREERRAARVRASGSVRPFDDRAAILEFAVATRDGTVARHTETELRVVLETVQPDTAVTLRLRVRDDADGVELVESPQEQLAERGRYRITAALPPALLERDGRYRLELEAAVEADGERTRIGRAIGLTVRPGPEDDPDVVEETLGEAGGPVEGEPVAIFADWAVEPL